MQRPEPDAPSSAWIYGDSLRVAGVSWMRHHAKLFAPLPHLSTSIKPHDRPRPPSLRPTYRYVVGMEEPRPVVRSSLTIRRTTLRSTRTMLLILPTSTALMVGGSISVR